MRYDQDSNIRMVARSLIARFGAAALKIVQERIDESVLADEETGVRFWRSVEVAARKILRRG
jgi:hypothetical protein